MCDLQFVAGGSSRAKRASPVRSSPALLQVLLIRYCLLKVLHAILDVLENVRHKAIDHPGL
jgi:ABC-type arginine transport system permease subunit